MKKSDKKALANNILKGALSIGKTIVSGFNPVIGGAIGAAEGVVKSVNAEKAKNLASKTGGEGCINYPMLIGQIGSAVIVIGGAVAFIMGWLTIEDLKQILKLWESTQ